MYHVSAVFATLALLATGMIPIQIKFSLLPETAMRAVCVSGLIFCAAAMASITAAAIRDNKQPETI